jgi:hypothetical protein
MKKPVRPVPADMDNKYERSAVLCTAMLGFVLQSCSLCFLSVLNQVLIAVWLV